jgi:hypothetical protein
MSIKYNVFKSKIRETYWTKYKNCTYSEANELAKP